MLLDLVSSWKLDCIRLLESAPPQCLAPFHGTFLPKLESSCPDFCVLLISVSGSAHSSCSPTVSTELSASCFVLLFSVFDFGFGALGASWVRTSSQRTVTWGTDGPEDTQEAGITFMGEPTSRVLCSLHYSLWRFLPGFLWQSRSVFSVPPCVGVVLLSLPPTAV